TLLMAHPIKAEVVTQTTEGVQQEENKKEEYMKRMGITDSDLEPGGYFDKRVKGYLEGYADGQKKNARKPDSNSYGPNFGAYDGYRDGYDQGYDEGWRKANEAGGSHNEESNDDSQTEESNDGSEGTQDQDKPVSDLLSVIGNLITFVLNWFSLA
ncbi:TPA: hypothetical protein ACQOCV_001620, partial [Streptococcus pyogenes]